MIWTYSEVNSEGSYHCIGGGEYDSAGNTYSQGAFNADDIARAAVFHIRHWLAGGNTESRTAAYQLLRGLTYLQTSVGPEAGNVVLWMQPNGRLQPSAEPREEPDPSDSGPSFWLARTVWALGEGVRAFQADYGSFAEFLRDRLELAIAALERQVLTRYGTDILVGGHPAPAWLISDGADATAEAMLGLIAYLDDGGGSWAARRALGCFAEGVARLSAGASRDWPYGALLPWARSRSIWHAWGSQMATALVGAAQSLKRPDLLAPAVTDSVSFTSHLLIAGGADKGWLPSSTNRTQVAYGADSRLQALLAAAAATRSSGLRRLAGVAAAWYFGLNPAGEPMYDPTTGRTYDGVSEAGVVNRNSGAESTIHGLMSMLALDSAPDVARQARIARVVERHTSQLLKVEGARLGGGATLATDPTLRGTQVGLPPGGWIDFGVVANEPVLVQPISIQTDSQGTGRTAWFSGHVLLGELTHQAASREREESATSALCVGRLPRVLQPGKPLVARQASTNGTTALQAVLIQPLVESIVLGGGAIGRAVLRSFAISPQSVRIHVNEMTSATVFVYGSSGRLKTTRQASGPILTVIVPTEGFTVVEFAKHKRLDR